MSTSERISKVEGMYDALKRAKGGDWYKKARKFVKTVEKRLLNMCDEDFQTAVTYWEEKFLPDAP